MIQVSHPIRLTPFLMILLMLFALMLQGCGGGGGGGGGAPVVNADPTGYYTNTGFVDVKAADNTAQRLVQDIQGMVHDGQLMMLSDTENLTYVGTFTVSGNDFSGTVTVYEGDVMVQENVPLSGMITEGSKITGTLGGTEVANGTFQLDYAPLVDNGPVDMSMVVRLLFWRTVVINSPIPTMGVKNDSAPVPNISSSSGSDIFNNCRFNGRIEPIANTHLYTVAVTMTSCSPGAKDVEAIPTYTGLVSVRSEVNSNDRLILVLTNGAYDFSGEYRECLVIGC